MRIGLRRLELLGSDGWTCNGAEVVVKMYYMTPASSLFWSSKALSAVWGDAFHEPDFKTDDALRTTLKDQPIASVGSHLVAAQFKRARVERVAVRLKQLLAAEAQGASEAVAV